MSSSLRAFWACVFVFVFLGCASFGADSAPETGLGSLNDDGDDDDNTPIVGDASIGEGPGTIFSGDVGDGTGVPTAIVGGALSSVRISPEDAELEFDPTQPGQLEYQVFGTLVDTGVEEDVTNRAVFWVSENHLVGGFAGNGPLFGTSPVSPRGGLVEVSAVLFTTATEMVTLTTNLTVRLRATLPDPRTDGTTAFEIPADPGTLFAGPADPTRAPTLVYPNNGVLLPPNLARLEVHFLQQSALNTLYQVAFTGSNVSLEYFLRCGPALNEGCGFELDAAAFGYLAESSRGGDPVELVVRGTDDTGAAVGESATFTLQFSETNVEGAVYYWTTSQTDARGPRIVRFDFGAAATVPEDFIVTGEGPLPDGECVGCHALSRDGTKIVASLNGQGTNNPRGGAQVLVNDLATPPTDPAFFDRAGDAPLGGPALPDVLQFASWNPDGSRFVGIWGDSADPTVNNNLWFYDGDTGVRIPAETIALPFEPDHPDWSPDGTLIAFTHVGQHQSSQKPYSGGIDLIRNDGAGWSAPESILPIVLGLNRFNPSFVPDSSFLIYTTSTCGCTMFGGTCTAPINDANCDGDTDQSSVTWAVQPIVGAAPVLLARSAQGGVMDGAATQLSDTFPRTSPFRGTYRDGDLFWFTVASLRREGLRNLQPINQQLWMFAIDPARILAGEDGSFPGFYLPFQDLTTRNHIAQWTERVISDTPPPPVPTPPPPPEEPVPPPIVE